MGTSANRFLDLTVEKLSRGVRLLEKSFSIVRGGGLEGCVSRGKGWPLA